jgi:type I pantothenate kinase
MSWEVLSLADLASVPFEGDATVPELAPDEVTAVYLPLCQLLRDRAGRQPWVVSVAGSVAVGKSTTARAMRDLLSRWPSPGEAVVVGTDGFLLPNTDLAARGILHRKGFPESYDVAALARFVADVRDGAALRAPAYDHLIYDVVAGAGPVVAGPDVLIVEGVNALQPEVAAQVDVGLYVDAPVENIRNWYTERFRILTAAATHDPTSFYHQWSGLDEASLDSLAGMVWDHVNGPNLTDHILPTRDRADIVVVKGADHRVAEIRVRH